MATAAEYAQWIVKNADKRGTPEFDTVARAYQLAKSQSAPAPEPAPKEQAGFFSSLLKGATELGEAPAAARFAAAKTPEEQAKARASWLCPARPASQPA